MPALFSHLPLLPVVSTQSLPGEDLLHPLSRIAPILIPASALKTVLGVLPATSEYWALLKEDIPLDVAVGLLDAGASKIVTPNVQLIDQIPSERLVLALNSESLEAVAGEVEDLPSKIAGILLETPLAKSGFDKNLITAARTALGGKASRDSKDLFVLPTDDAKPTLEQLEALASWRLGTTPSLMTTVLSATPPPVDATGLEKLPASKPPSGYHIPLDVLFLSSLTTDRPDTLYATSVTSINSQPLGLVYSSPLSLSLSIYHAQATYYSRSRESLWVKGATSGATQSVVAIRRDCDGDALEFIVEQKSGTGFCHTPRAASCFGPTGGLIALEETIKERQANAPQGSYTKRLFDDATLLEAKIREEADEVIRAKNWDETRLEAADLLYFLMVRCATMGVSLADVANVLDSRACKVTRRPGNAKPAFLQAKSSSSVGTVGDLTPKTAPRDLPKVPSPVKMGTVPENAVASEEAIVPPVYDMKNLSESERQDLLKRPLTDSKEMLDKVTPILQSVRNKGDAALLNYVATLDKCKAAAQPATQNKPFNVVMQAPFHESLMVLPEKTKTAIDVAFANIHRFHAKQMEKEAQPIRVETMPGVVCSRFARAIDRVGLYVPGGTAVLPSTAMMLGIPALIAGCQHISFATPPNAEGVVRPEIVYIAHKCGAKEIIRAGGAHAIASMAYGTETVTKVDKIFGPGNQWVTAAKMAVSMDLGACVGIDMPAGPSEVLVIADKTANPVFAAADLLSQAEHGVDSQVVLLAIDLTDKHLDEIKEQVHKQALALPRVDIVRKCIRKSLILRLPTLEDAIKFSNDYAPEHLILHLEDAPATLDSIRNAGSVFVGKWSPESLGDYASGTNHTLPTSAYARQYSGVSTSSFLKHITSQQLTADGLKLLGPTVDHLAQIEGLDAHARAVTLRLASADIQ